MKLVKTVLFKVPGMGCAPGKCSTGTCGLSSSQPVQWSGDTNGEMLRVAGIPGCQQLKRDPREMLLSALTHPGTVSSSGQPVGTFGGFTPQRYIYTVVSHAPVPLLKN